MQQSKVRAALRALEAAICAEVTCASRWMRVADSPVPKLAKRWIAEGKLPSARPSKHLLCDRLVHDELIASTRRADPMSPSTDGRDVGELDPEIVGAAA